MSTYAHRAQQICEELTNKNVTPQRLKQLEAELDEIEVAAKTLEAGRRWASGASPAEHGYANTNPGDHDSIGFKGFGPNMENQIRPTSIYEMDREQIAALKQAAQQRTPFKVQLGQKGIEHGSFTGQIHTKTAVTAGGLTPNLLPPIQQPGPGGFWGLPYELTRVANFLPNVAFEGPGMAYFSHGSNGAEAAYTAEAAPKPDLTPVISEVYIRASKVAGLINLTHELVQDAGDAFGAALVSDLARSVYNAESNLLLNAVKATNGFAGVNKVSGTLTRALDTAGSEPPLDTLSKAFGDLRAAFFVPDLVIVHPNTLGALRRLKDTQGRYLLQLMQGAGGIDQTSETETLWGVKCVQSTQQSAGTAAVLSVQSGAAVVYVREALTTFFDPYTQSANNIYTYIAETRLALATPRPGAINLVTGLPTS